MPHDKEQSHLKMHPKIPNQGSHLRHPELNQIDLWGNQSEWAWGRPEQNSTPQGSRDISSSSEVTKIDAFHGIDEIRGGGENVRWEGTVDVTDRDNQFLNLFPAFPEAFSKSHYPLLPKVP